MVVQAAVRGQPTPGAAAAAWLLYGPADRGATHGHALFHAIYFPNPPAPELPWAPAPVGRTPAEAQRGPGGAVPPRRVGNHLRR